MGKNYTFSTVAYIFMEINTKNSGRIHYKLVVVTSGEGPETSNYSKGLF